MKIKENEIQGERKSERKKQSIKQRKKRKDRKKRKIGIQERKLVKRHIERKIDA